MSMSAAEQYLLELMNRARLDPLGEAARQGIDLNAGLKAGTITADSKGVLAPNALLDLAATNHSLFMLAADSFSHTGENGTLGGQRIKLTGYASNAWAENLSLKQTVAGQSLEAMMDGMNRDMFLNASQRLALMRSDLREVGVSHEVGVFTQAGNNFDVDALTVNYASSGKVRFLTGVAYQDADGDGFYSIGEGLENVNFSVTGGLSAKTAAAGGYAVAVDPLATSAAVVGRAGTLDFTATVDMTGGNVKLDLVSGTTFHSSGSIVLGTGIRNATLLGLDDLNATGTINNNVLIGNAGANTLIGFKGNDQLTGYAGDDILDGGTAFDKLNGGTGDDALTGGTGSDTFIFTAGDGNDRVLDFSIAEGDKLRLDDALWGNVTLRTAGVVSRFADKVAGEVILDFGDGDIIHLVGLTAVSGLGTVIEIY